MISNIASKVILARLDCLSPASSYRNGYEKGSRCEWLPSRLCRTAQGLGKGELESVDSADKRAKDIRE